MNIAASGLPLYYDVHFVRLSLRFLTQTIQNSLILNMQIADFSISDLDLDHFTIVKKYNDSSSFLDFRV